jgi:site-specific recombinase XerD
VDIPGWRAWTRSRALSDETRRAYERELKALNKQLPIDVDDAEPKDLRPILEASTGSPSTVNRRVAAWASYYGWLVRIDKRSDDPTRHLDRPKVRPGLPRPVDDVDSVLARLPARLQAVAVFLLETGLRISEACAVDVDPSRVPDGLIVRGKGRKERWVPLNAVAREAIAELGGRLAMSPGQVQAGLRAVGITPHRLRHTFATTRLENGCPIEVLQLLLGHSSPATTLVYAKVSKRRLREGNEVTG